MFKKLINEFINASIIEKFNTLASLFTITGVSLLTIFSALGKVSLIQIAVSCFVFGFILMFVAVLIAILLMFIEKFNKKIHPMLLALLTIGIVLLILGFLFFSVFTGIELIKSFEDY